jgi:hypothetical protein
MFATAHLYQVCGTSGAFCFVRFFLQSALVFTFLVLRNSKGLGYQWKGARNESRRRSYPEEWQSGDDHHGPVSYGHKLDLCVV